MFPFWIAHEASSSDFAYFEAAFQPIKIMLICEFLVERLFTMAKSFIANYFTAIVSEASGELHEGIIELFEIALTSNRNFQWLWTRKNTQISINRSIKSTDYSR